jgi:hypothetical protein
MTVQECTPQVQPNATQIRVLYVLDTRGVATWHEVAGIVRERSGRTVRPNESTRKTMHARGWIAVLEGGRVRITPEGRSALLLP